VNAGFCIIKTLLEIDLMVLLWLNSSQFYSKKIRWEIHV